jgi:AcrR family transcriptional regulator
LRRTQQERTDTTRRALVLAARRLFTSNGYAATSTTDVAREAGVARGGLYHHFPDKEALFRAVHESIEEEMAAAIVRATDGVADPYDALVAGLDAFLDHCLVPSTARIALEQAPSVLGWAEWREIDNRHGLGLVTVALHAAMDAGALRPQPVRPLAHLLISACGEAGLLIAASPDPEAEQAEVRATLLSLLAGLCPHPT